MTNKVKATIKLNEREKTMCKFAADFFDILWKSAKDAESQYADNRGSYINNDNPFKVSVDDNQGLLSVYILKDMADFLHKVEETDEVYLYKEEI